jgi:hypothetical protein
MLCKGCGALRLPLTATAPHTCMQKLVLSYTEGGHSVREFQCSARPELVQGAVPCMISSLTGDEYITFSIWNITLFF